MRTTRRRLSFEKRITYFALFGGLPAVAISMIFLWTGDYAPRVQWTCTLLILCVWTGFAFGVHERIVHPLRTLSNLLAALREGDYSLRARAPREDALGEVMTEVNEMGEMLREQRWSAVEATQLLQKVMEEIDVAVFAFDGEERLRLVNRQGERLLGQPSERLLGRLAAELDLSDCLDPDAPRTLQNAFPAATGRWGIRQSTFREHGASHRLLVVSDLTRELREEELAAWQRLVRVLGHELNNSLAPIKSITGSLTTVLNQQTPPPDWKEDMRQGLAVVGSRTEALSRFTGAYARLAKLPEPNLATVKVSEWVRRVTKLENRRKVEVEPGPELSIRADADQLEQLLINLIRNAVDASSQTDGDVRVGWHRNHSFLEVWVQDGGPGLSSDANLFVPFFTTKPGGSGIGLVLGRKIAENHGGTLTLENRRDGRGCEARLRIPLEPQSVANSPRRDS